MNKNLGAAAKPQGFYISKYFRFNFPLADAVT